MEGEVEAEIMYASGKKGVLLATRKVITVSFSLSVTFPFVFTILHFALNGCSAQERERERERGAGGSFTTVSCQQQMH